MSAAEGLEAEVQVIQKELFPVKYKDLEVRRWGDKVSVFCRDFCFCTYSMNDKFTGQFGTSSRKNKR